MKKAVKDLQREQVIAGKKKVIEKRKQEREMKKEEPKEQKEKAGVLDGVQKNMKLGTMFKQRKADMQAELQKMRDQQKA